MSSSLTNLQAEIDALTVADTQVLADANAYSDSLVVGLWDDRGNFDASVNAFPSTGGSGAGGAINKGDIWTISIGGTIAGVVVAPKQTVRAMADVPGQTAANWAFGLANTDIENNITAGVTGKAPSQDAVYQAIAAASALSVSKTALLDANGDVLLSHLVNTPYDICGSMLGGLGVANAVISRFITPRAFVITQLLSGCVAACATPGTGSVVFTVKKNGSSIATITFAAGTNYSTNSSTSGPSLFTNTEKYIYSNNSVIASANISVARFGLGGLSSTPGGF